MAWYNPATWFASDAIESAGDTAEGWLFSIKKLRANIAAGKYTGATLIEAKAGLADAEAGYIKNFGPIPETYEEAHAQGVTIMSTYVDEQTVAALKDPLKPFDGEWLANMWDKIPAWLKWTLLAIAALLAVNALTKLKALAPASTSRRRAA